MVSMITTVAITWWRHQMETFCALLAFCAGNSPVTGEFPSQRPVMRSFDVLLHLHLNKRFSQPSGRRWFDAPLHWLWRHCNASYLILVDAPNVELIWLLHARKSTKRDQWITLIPSSSCSHTLGSFFFALGQDEISQKAVCGRVLFSARHYEVLGVLRMILANSIGCFGHGFTYNGILSFNNNCVNERSLALHPRNCC